MPLGALLNVVYSSLLEVKDAAILDAQNDQRERLDEILSSETFEPEREEKRAGPQPPQRPSRPPAQRPRSSSSQGDLRALMAATKLPQAGVGVQGKKHGRRKRGGKP